MANTRMTKLQAVNTVLSLIGEAPINNLSDSGATASVIEAKTLIDDISLEVQTDGWSFNTEYNFPMVPTVEGWILLPATCLAIRCQSHPQLDVVERNGRLYSRYNRTDVFTDTLKVQMVLLFEFETLPEAVKRYITIRAGRIFQDRFLGGTESHGFTAVDESRAKAAFLLAEAEAANFTVFDSYDTFRIIDRNFSGRRFNV